MHHLDCIDVHHLEPSDFVSLDSESVPMIPSVIPYIYIYIYPSHLEAKAIWSGTNCLTNGSLAVKTGGNQNCLWSPNPPKKLPEWENGRPCPGQSLG